MSVYERFGVTPIINALGTATRVGGLLMPPEVVAAMAEAATEYVDLAELHERAGEVIARHTGAEAGYVTSGAAGGLLLAAAACMTGDDPARIRRLPNTDGMKNEIVIHRAHRIAYDQAFRAAGARLVEVGTSYTTAPWELEGAIGERTAAIAYIVSPHVGRGALPFEQVVTIARARGVPTIVDAASMLPPVANLRRWTALGADLVIFSGGKGIRGPQSTGILCGRADLVRAAALNGNPNHGIGRAAKVSKEEVVGLLTALELFVGMDEAAELARRRRMAAQIAASLTGRRGVTAELVEDPERWPVPVVLVTLDRQAGLTVDEVIQRLRRGAPPIAVRSYYDQLLVNPHGLKDGEAEIVAARLGAALQPR